jgi:hypothetical protein
MKKQMTALFVAVALLLPLGTVSAGNHSHDVVSTGVGLVKLPFKVVGGVIGGVVGALTGGAEGVVDTWSSVNDQYATNMFLKIPVGVVGLAYAVPVGLVTGAPSQAIETAKVGYNWLD